MTVAIIGAVSLNGVYGMEEDGKQIIPWRSKADMAFFKKQTTGSTVIMGRSTWESLPPKFRPLPDRENIVLSRSISSVGCDDVRVVDTLEQAVELASRENIFIIGGKELWLSGMKDFATEFYITEIATSISYRSGVFTCPELLHPALEVECWREVLEEHQEEINSVPDTLVSMYKYTKY